MNKQIVYLSISAVVLLLIYILMQSTSAPEAKHEQLVEVDTSLVTELVVTSEQGSVTLQRDDDNWMVVDPYEYRANKNFVETLLEKLTDLRIEAEVTGKKDRHGEFEVTDEQAVYVKIDQGGDTSEILFGKSSRNRGQTYARLPGKDKVYLIRGSYSVATRRPPDAWRDKKITDFKQDEIIAVDLPEIDLAKQGESWNALTPDGDEFTPDEAKVKRVTRALANLRTSDFPGEAAYQGINWSRPEHTFTLQLTDGGQRSIAIYPVPDEENRYFLRYSDSTGMKDTVFRIYSGVVNTLLWDETDLRPAAEDAS
ncbi:DUF4340 domain-containing protein [bacterium]|nr:DUF4340 domain-containing protein [bacterium]